MKPYSKDLRLKVLDAIDRGMPRSEVACIFGISEPSIKWHCPALAYGLPLSHSASFHSKLLVL